MVRANRRGQGLGVIKYRTGCEKLIFEVLGGVFGNRLSGLLMLLIFTFFHLAVRTPPLLVKSILDYARPDS